MSLLGPKDFNYLAFQSFVFERHLLKVVLETRHVHLLCSCEIKYRNFQKTLTFEGQYEIFFSDTNLFKCCRMSLIID